MNHLPSNEPPLRMNPSPPLPSPSNEPPSSSNEPPLAPYRGGSFEPPYFTFPSTISKFMHFFTIEAWEGGANGVNLINQTGWL